MVKHQNELLNLELKQPPRKPGPLSLQGLWILNRLDLQNRITLSQNNDFLPNNLITYMIEIVKLCIKAMITSDDDILTNILQPYKQIQC